VRLGCVCASPAPLRPAQVPLMHPLVAETPSVVWPKLPYSTLQGGSYAGTSASAANSAPAAQLPGREPRAGYNDTECAARGRRLSIVVRYISSFKLFNVVRRPAQQAQHAQLFGNSWVAAVPISLRRRCAHSKTVPWFGCAACSKHRRSTSCIVPLSRTLPINASARVVGGCRTWPDKTAAVLTLY
jgi:hypothetical protein